MFKLLKYLFKDFYLFTAAYSNNVFPEPLNDIEEKEVLNRYFNGDKNARDTLIERNLRLVAHIVKKYDCNSYDIDDLISIGTIGLIKGVDSYSKEKGTKLTTYCARCIENEILMFFRGNKKNSKNISLNEKVGFDKDGNEITFLDILKTPNHDYIMDIHKNNLENNLKKYFSVLTPREKEIIELRYGINNKKEVTQKSLASKLGISRSYVSRIEKRALSKMLKEFIKNKDN